jgi:hypothetical protein
MSPTSPAARFAAAGGKLAATVESRVRGLGSFLPIIEQNTPQIFEQFYKIRTKNNLPKI